jgi:hypothetical protein
VGSFVQITQEGGHQKRIAELDDEAKLAFELVGLRKDGIILPDFRINGDGWREIGAW